MALREPPAMLLWPLRPAAQTTAPARAGVLGAGSAAGGVPGARSGASVTKRKYDFEFPLCACVRDEHTLPSQQDLLFGPLLFS